MKQKGNKESDTADYAGGLGGSKKDKTCHNSGKKGHFKAGCWAKGGKEGQGPKKDQPGKKVPVNAAKVEGEKEKEDDDGV